MANMTNDKPETSQASGRLSPSSEKAPESNASKGLFNRMGDLPQFKFGGKLLDGAALNWGIGIIASCGFLVSSRAPKRSVQC